MKEGLRKGQLEEPWYYYYDCYRTPLMRLPPMASHHTDRSIMPVMSRHSSVMYSLTSSNPPDHACGPCHHRAVPSIQALHGFQEAAINCPPSYRRARGEEGDCGLVVLVVVVVLL